MPKKKKKVHRSATSRVEGTLRSFNISPRGHIEGALLETSTGTVQFNFHKHDAEAVAASLQIGAVMQLRGELETDDWDHPVYLLSAGADAEAHGEIVRLNYALHGEVNGCQLEDGTFVHLKPEGAKKYRLRVGQKIKAKGLQRSGSAATVLEATSVARWRAADAEPTRARASARVSRGGAPGR